MIQLSDSAVAPAQHSDERPAPRRQKRRFVGAMRLVLPGIAIGLVVLVVAWPKILGKWPA